MSNVWEMIQEKKKIEKHVTKKYKHTLVPSQRYQDSRHLLQNPAVPKYVIGFSNCAQRFTGSNYLDEDSPLLICALLTLWELNIYPKEFEKIMIKRIIKLPIVTILWRTHSLCQGSLGCILLRNLMIDCPLLMYQEIFWQF